MFSDESKLNRFRASDDNLKGWLVEYDNSVNIANDHDFPEIWKEADHPGARYPYKDLSMEISFSVPNSTSKATFTTPPALS